MGDNRNKKYLGGYMTVEATLIMPVVLYVCFFIAYTGIFIYDRCVMKQDAFRVALRGSSMYGQDNEEACYAAEKQMEIISSDKYIATESTYEITVRNKVSVSVSGYVDMPFWGLAGLSEEKGFAITETVECKDLCPALFIRMCRQITETMEKGVD